MYKAPRISSTIGSMQRFLEKINRPTDPYHYLSFSETPEARAILDKRYQAGRMTYCLPIEAFCVACGISPMRILEIIASVAIRLGAQASSMMMAAAQPDVTEAIVDAALLPDGHADRELFAKATGMLPTPKSAQTIIQVTQNASANAASVSASPVSAPPPEQTIRRMVDRFNASRSLPPSSAVPIPTIDILPEPVPVEVMEEEEDNA